MRMARLAAPIRPSQEETGGQSDIPCEVLKCAVPISGCAHLTSRPIASSIECALAECSASCRRMPIEFLAGCT